MVAEDMKVVDLEGQNLNITNVFEPNGMIIIDSLLFIVDSKGEFCFHVFNTNTFRPVVEFGRKGRGPDEFIDPVIINHVVNTTGRPEVLSIFDRSRKRISYVSIPSIPGNPDTIIKSENLPPEMGKVAGIIYSDDSNAIYIPYEEDFSGRFSIYDYAEENQTFTPFLPSPGFKIHANNLYPVYATSSYCTDENREMFVAIPALMGELDFFGLSGTYLHTSVIERRRELRKAREKELVFNVPGVYYYLSSISAVDDRIYVLICRKEYPDFKSVSDAQIYVFDWDGNAYIRYGLDREITQIAFDRRNNQFIGYSNSDFNLPFIKYELK
jgi:hypothetical protein